MEDRITEKVYCYDHPSAYQGNNNLLAALAMQKRDCCDPAAMAAMMNGGMNGQWNNPFIYLVWMMFANRFFGNGEYGINGQNAQNVETMNQLQAIRTQMQENQNSSLVMDAIKGNSVAISQLASNLNCDYNSLQSAVLGVKSAIDKVAGSVGFNAERVINAANLGDANIVSKLQECCCNVRTEIAESGASTRLQMCQDHGSVMNKIDTINAHQMMQGFQHYDGIMGAIASFKAENQLQNCQQTAALRDGQRDLGNALTQGFASLGYQQNADKSEIIQAGNANTQRIIDTLNCHWNQQLQQSYNDARLEMSQLKQNQYLAGLITGNGCGCGSNC